MINNLNSFGSELSRKVKLVQVDNYLCLNQANPEKLLFSSSLDHDGYLLATVIENYAVQK